MSMKLTFCLLKKNFAIYTLLIKFLTVVECALRMSIVVDLLQVRDLRETQAVDNSSTNH